MFLNISEFASEDTIRIFRNIIFAPITEEIVFRALIVSCLFMNWKQQRDSAFSSTLSINYLALAGHSTVYFGIAHLHHLYEKIRTGERILPACLSTLIQFTYTSIFGMIAALLFIRTGSIFPPIVSHMICNYVGLPNVGFLSQLHSNGSNPLSFLYNYRWLLIFLHGLGLVCFGLILFRWTESDSHNSYFYERK